MMLFLFQDVGVPRRQQGLLGSSLWGTLRLVYQFIRKWIFLGMPQSKHTNGLGGHQAHVVVVIGGRAIPPHDFKVFAFMSSFALILTVSCEVNATLSPILLRKREKEGAVLHICCTHGLTDLQFNLKRD
jgi:hypothetical protein